jgi:hypothetical protein
MRKRVQRVARAVADGDALALGQARRLDHARLVAALHVLVGGGGVGERPGLGGGDRLLAHDLLGEPLVRLHARAVFRRPEHLHARRPHGREWVFRADDDQADAVAADELLDRVEVHRVDRDVVGDLRGARVARHGVQRRDPRRVRQFPSQGVLAPAIADQKDFHAVRRSG